MWPDNIHHVWGKSRQPQPQEDGKSGATRLEVVGSQAKNHDSNGCTKNDFSDRDILTLQ